MAVWMAVVAVWMAGVAVCRTGVAVWRAGVAVCRAGVAVCSAGIAGWLDSLISQVLIECDHLSPMLKSKKDLKKEWLALLSTEPSLWHMPVVPFLGI